MSRRLFGLLLFLCSVVASPFVGWLAIQNIESPRYLCDMLDLLRFCWLGIAAGLLMVVDASARPYTIGRTVVGAVVVTVWLLAHLGTGLLMRTQVPI